MNGHADTSGAYNITSQLECHLWPRSDHTRNAIQMAFRWLVDGWPLLYAHWAVAR